jgi:hypothetical protein
VGTPLEEWVEGVRSAMTAPPLRRSEKSWPGADPKWAIGDALLVVPEDDRDRVAETAGLAKGDGRSYWRTAAAWPPSTRTVPASWTVYRELASLPDRFTIIFPKMNMRQAFEARTGQQMDRKATHRLDDEELIDELVRLMLSERGATVVPQIVARLNSSKEGRRTASARRSAGALHRLHEEIRLVQKEIKKLRSTKSARLRIMEVRKRLLDTEVNVEEIGLLYNDPEERQAADDDQWRSLAELVIELRDSADKVANNILTGLDVIEAEAWDETDGWSIAELSVGGDDEIVDAEIVDED